MAISVSGVVVPTGGVAVLTASGIASSGVTFSRSFGSGAYSVIDTTTNPGNFCVLIDYGINLPGPLPNDQGDWNYEVTDGLTQASVSLVPYTALVFSVTDSLTVTLIRSILSGINNLVLPAGYKRPTVYHEMPKTGFPPLPFIFVTQIGLEQADTQIGQDFPLVQQLNNNYLMQNYSVMAKRTWRVSTYSRTAGEREYYRGVVVGIFQTFLSSILQPIGSDMSHNFIVQSGQDSGGDADPGFYWSDMMLSAKGIYNTTFVPQIGTIATISTTLSGSGVVDKIVVD